MPLWSFLDPAWKRCIWCTARARRWHAANPTLAAEHGRRWRETNIEQARDYQKRWREDNLEHARERSRRWGAEHPDRIREIASRRRARINGAAVGDIPRDAEEQLLGFQAERCAYCHVDLAITGFHMDHVVPLSRGGAHAWDNLVLACPPCNLSKGDRLVEDWCPFA